MAKRIRDVLSQKSKKVWTIDPDASVYDAVDLMTTHSIGSVVVTKKGAVVGILTEADYARKVVLEGKSARDTRVGDAMTMELVVVNGDCSVEEGLALMSKWGFRHLPVMEETTLQGIVSGGDLVKAMLDEERFLTDQLVRYIQHPY
jgi:CBS domain-containing protein